MLTKTKLPRNNKVTLRRTVGFLHVELGTKYDRYEYGGNMGNTYERDIAPLIEQLFGAPARRMLEVLGEYYCDGRNVHDCEAYSWIRILRHSPAEQANREADYKLQLAAKEELRTRREEILSRLTPEERRIVGV